MAAADYWLIVPDIGSHETRGRREMRSTRGAMNPATKRATTTGTNTVSAEFSSPFTAALRAETTLANIPPDQTIFAQGTAADAAYFIHSGLVKIAVVSKSGQEAVVQVLTPRTLVGESCIVRNTRRMASAISMTECVIERIGASTMRQALDIDLQFSRFLLENLLIRARQIQEQLIDQHFHSAELRLARTLLRLSNIDRNDEIEASLPHLSQSILAEMIGVKEWSSITAN
jgi:CRP/FNR family transcriptional regulator, cyclic AMP receptor protein